MSEILFSPADWQKMRFLTSGEEILSGSLAAASALLAKFWTISPKKTNERIAVLEEIKAQSLRSLDFCPPMSRTGLLLISLATQADKQKAVIEKGVASWNKVRDSLPGVSKVLMPRPGFGGSFVQKFATKNLASLPVLLEKWDPQHRFFHNLEKLNIFFRQWQDDVLTPLGFVAWLDGKGAANALDSVEYLEPSGRWRYKCHFQKSPDDKSGSSSGARVHQYRNVIDGKGGKGGKGKYWHLLPLFTADNQVFDEEGIGKAIWVCDAKGNFYSGSSEIGKFHHSTFLAGQHIIAGGEWYLVNGKVLLISNSSGHYKPTRHQLFNALRILGTRVDLSKTIVQLEIEDHHVPYEEFMRTGGNPAYVYADDSAGEEALEACRNRRENFTLSQSAARLRETPYYGSKPPVRFHPRPLNRADGRVVSPTAPLTPVAVPTPTPASIPVAPPRHQVVFHRGALKR